MKLGGVPPHNSTAQIVDELTTSKANDRGNDLRVGAQDIFIFVEAEAKRLAEAIKTYPAEIRTQVWKEIATRTTSDFKSGRHIAFPDWGGISTATAAAAMEGVKAGFEPSALYEAAGERNQALFSLLTNTHKQTEVFGCSLALRNETLVLLVMTSDANKTQPFVPPVFEGFPTLVEQREPPVPH